MQSRSELQAFHDLIAPITDCAGDDSVRVSSADLPSRNRCYGICTIVARPNSPAIPI
jgi:hypothetical protein